MEKLQKLRAIAQAVPGRKVSIEPHGTGEALFLDSGPVEGGEPWESLHGLNIVYLTDPAYQWPEVRKFLETFSPGEVLQLLDLIDALKERVRELEESYEE